MGTIKYLEVGTRVEYEVKEYNPSTSSTETKTRTGTIRRIQTRSSIGYTTHELTIEPDGGGLVRRTVGTRYADRVTIID